MRDRGTLDGIAADLAAAAGLLTRLPLHRLGIGLTAGGAGSAWAWPLVGALVGGLAGALAGAAAGLGLPAGAVAALVLAAQALLTGAMHEDGLADTADGFWGGATPQRRLEIMKDSRNGSYGVLALVLVTLARWSALAALVQAGAAWPALVAAGALSRAPMAVVMRALPNARGSGLAASVGRPGGERVGLAVALALAVGLACTGAALPLLAASVALVTLAAALVARERIGGQTGDVLGAVQQLAELAVLTAMAATLA